MSTSWFEWKLWENKNYSLIKEDIDCGGTFMTFYRLYKNDKDFTYIELGKGVGEAIEEIVQELNVAKTDLKVLRKYINAKD